MGEGEGERGREGGGGVTPFLMTKQKESENFIPFIILFLDFTIMAEVMK